ncbi:MAG: hypothetical protein ACE5JN_13880 [Candidatus Methylomirabilia bacterium]
MKRITLGLALSLALAFGLTLLPGTAWAWGPHAFHGGVHPGVRHGHGGVFIRDRHPFVHHEFKIRRRRRHFTHHGFNHHSASVHPVPKAVWIPGFWQWNGLGWVRVPGHWLR